MTTKRAATAPRLAGEEHAGVACSNGDDDEDDLCAFEQW